MITKFSNEGGAVADTVANIFVAVQKRFLMQWSRHRHWPEAHLLAGCAVADLIRGSSSRIPILSKAISSTLDALADLTPTLILDAYVFEAVVDVLSEIQAAASKRT